MNKLKVALGIFLSLLLFAGGYLLGYSNHKLKLSDNLPKGSQESTVATSTSVSVVPKSTTGGANVVLEQKYVASVNGKRVEVPIKDTKEPVSGVLKQEIDVSNLVRPLLPKWEAGIGVGRHGSETYVPVSVQRNYKPGKALEVQIHVGTDGGISGGSVVHKWTF